MNEIKMVGFALLFLLCVYYWWQTIDMLSTKPMDVVNTVVVAIATCVITYIVYSWSPYIKQIKNSGDFDFVLIIIFVFMAMAFTATTYGFMKISKTNYQYTEGEGHLLVAGPALVWSLLWLVTLRVLGPIHFEIFETQKVTNTSLLVSLSIFAVLFISEYVGNLRNIEAKMAEVVTFRGGRRTGQGLKEGINPLPGILPLFFQVGFYALARWSIFFGAVRGFPPTPITFTGTMVAYSYDGKAVVLNVSAIGKIVDPTIVDNLMEDGAENPREQLKRLFAECFQQGANMFILTCRWQTLVNGSSLASQMVRSMKESMKHLGLELTNASIEWLGFQDQEQQRIFQQLAGRDFRQMNQSMKAGEIERMVRSGLSREDAERVWEAFTKDGRGSFRLGA